MKFLYSTIAILAISASAMAQNYNSNTSTGTSSPYKYNESATTLLEDTLVDVLSSVQTIPFTFTFYGNAVTQYLASDNGYITFDTGATSSDPNNVSLPDAGGPNNAIYALWDDFELTTAGTDDQVRNFTYGSAPNRVHVIQWYSVAPVGGSGFIYAAIRLYECGDFDIVHNYASASTLTSTVGCEDATGTNGTQISGSPTLDISTLTGDPTDDEVFSFYWDLNQYDFSITSTDFSSFVSVGTNTVSGTLKNHGSVAITSFDLHYEIDGGGVQTMSVTSTVAANGGTFNYSHSIPWNVATGGIDHTLCVWADNLNGNADDRICNDQLCESLFSNNGVSGTRTVLMEEFTGSWCGYCPDGALKLDDMIANYPGNVVGVSIHNADAMTFSDGIQTGFNVTAFPGGMVNRTQVAGQAKEPFSRSLWEAEVVSQIGSYTPVDVSIAATYNSTSRELTIDLTADFVDYAGGDLRFVAMLVENGVTGTGSGYDQVNYYSSAHSSGGVGGASHLHYNDPTPIVGYVHNHVLRALPGGAFGNAGVISSPVSPGTNVSESFTLTVPTSVNANNIKVVGFVAYYSTTIGERSVLDVAEVTPTSFVSIDEHDIANNLLVYPNPANDFVQIEMLTGTGENPISVELMDMTGKLISSQSIFNNKTRLNTENLDAGIYLLSILTDKGNTVTKRLVIK
ncbi:MAG: Omp28-related outer membrane protein [Flavobacteriales bacterium]|nr:Omp28-related outer membrane protein [Flavobacteriales bacterium]